MIKYIEVEKKIALPESKRNQTEVSKYLDTQMRFMAALLFYDKTNPNRLTDKRPYVVIGKQ